MKRASAPSYDRFKSIVTFVLVVILLLMLLRGCATPAASPSPTENPLVSNPTEVIVTSPASNATEVPTLSPVLPTSEPSATPTSVATEPPTVASTPTVAGEAPTDTPVSPAPTQVQSASCNTSVPSRLSVGQKAQVLKRLNMRNEASIESALIQTNPTKTQVEIIGGPVCTPVGDHAYLWWQIRLASGAEGWSAESPLNEASYFLQPIP